MAIKQRGSWAAAMASLALISDCGGAAARAGSGGNATVTFSVTLPAGLTTTEGVVAVPWARRPAATR